MKLDLENKLIRKERNVANTNRRLQQAAGGVAILRYQI